MNELLENARRFAASEKLRNLATDLKRSAAAVERGLRVAAKLERGASTGVKDLAAMGEAETELVELNRALKAINGDAGGRKKANVFEATRRRIRQK